MMTGMPCIKRRFRTYLQPLLLPGLLVSSLVFSIPSPCVHAATGYIYDARGQLLNSVTDEEISFTYTYDSAGNILTAEQAGRPDADGDLLADADENESSCPYMYDADSDDDGIADGMEDANRNGEVDPRRNPTRASQTVTATESRTEPNSATPNRSRTLTEPGRCPAQTQGYSSRI